MKLLTKATIETFGDWLESIDDEGGIVLIDKIKGYTSFDVIAKLRGICRIKKIGHTGTLDPLATGLLMCCVGRKATRLISTFENDVKQYHCTLKIGATTKTYDLESEEDNFQDYSTVTKEQIHDVLENLSGEIMQIPPLFSAIKVNGVRAYTLARKSSDIELEARKITIFGYSDVEIDLPIIKFKVDCSKGTYIRTLANDIGKQLGCGAYLKELRRTKIAEYSVEDATTIDEMNVKRREYLQAKANNPQ